jgi:hypothetical protein
LGPDIGDRVGQIVSQIVSQPRGFVEREKEIRLEVGSLAGDRASSLLPAGVASDRLPR